jgi:hypothetical protein
MSNVVVSAYGLGDPPFHPPTPSQSNYVDGVFGVWAGNGANGNLTLSGLVVNSNAITSYPGGGPDDITNQATGFTFIVVNPATKITKVKVNADGSVTLTYAATAGYHYHIETATNLFPASWMIVNGSATNATGSVATFTDPNLVNANPRYYRTVSP